MIGFQGVGGRMLALLALPLFDYASGGKPGSHGIAWCFFCADHPVRVAPLSNAGAALLTIEPEKSA